MWIMFAGRPLNAAHMSRFKVEISTDQEPYKHCVEICFANASLSAHEYFETREEAIERYNEIGKLLEVKGFEEYWIKAKDEGK